jgi:hypothetical protein
MVPNVQFTVVPQCIFQFLVSWTTTLFLDALLILKGISVYMIYIYGLFGSAVGCQAISGVQERENKEREHRK